jgi:hypothetical protein
LPLSPAVAASPVALADGKPRSSIGKLLRRVRGDSAATSQSPPATPPSASSAACCRDVVSSPSTPDSQATPEAKAVLVAAKSSLDDLKALGKKSVALLYTATDRLQQTALHIAAFNDRVESVRWLLPNKKCPPEFVNAVDKNGQTALHVAASAKSLGSCVALIEGGASAAALDSKLTTPFHYAARSPALLPVMPAMLNGGVRLDARDEKGDTPIFQAAFKGAVQVVDWLLLHGASLATQNLAGENCLHAAARSGDVAVVKLLLDRGVPPAVRALDVGTPRDVAVACNNTDIVAAFDTYRHLQHASKKKKRHNRPVTTQVPLDNAAQTFARTVAGTLHSLDGSRTGSGTRRRRRSATLAASPIASRWCRPTAQWRCTSWRPIAPSRPS